MNIENNFKCDSCGSKKYRPKPKLTYRLVPSDPKFEVVKCKNCGLHSFFPIPSDKDLEWIYSNYASEGDRVKVEKDRQKYVYPRKIDLIKKHNPDAKSILDIGAGIGGFVSTAISNGYNAIGIELEEEQTELAKEHFNVNLIHTKFNEFVKKNDDTYDIVFLHHVVEHLQKPATVLKKIKPILNNDGLVLIEVPNQFFDLRRNINRFLRRIPRKHARHPYHHIHFFSPKTLRKMVEKAGYKVIELNEVGAKPAKINNLLVNLSKYLIQPLGYGIGSRIEIIAQNKL